MSINKDTALAIAKEFAKREYKNTCSQLLPESAEARLETKGVGHAHLGINEHYWSVLFALASTDPEVAVMTPDYVIVIVDAETGKSLWMPVM